MSNDAMFEVPQSRLEELTRNIKDLQAAVEHNGEMAQAEKAARLLAEADAERLAEALRAAVLLLGEHPILRAHATRTLPIINALAAYDALKGTNP